MKLLKFKDPITDVVAHDVALSEVNTDATSHTRLGWWIVLLGVGGFVLEPLLLEDALPNNVSIKSGKPQRR